MDLLGGLRRMVTGVIALVVISLGIFACGAMMAFVLSPKNAIEWRQIEALPVLDANGLGALKVGDQAAITGRLDGNKTITDDGLVAYEKDVWNVEQSTSSQSGTPSEPSGSWNMAEVNVPALSLAIAGGRIKTQAVTTITLGGAMHTTIQPGTSAISADFQGHKLADKSTRIQGFADGDLLTVVGQKSSGGALIPARLFGGDRVQLVNDIRQAAQTYFAAGVSAMICAPLFLLLGLGVLFFGRRKGWFG